VAPVVEQGARQRVCYLPPGQCVDVWTGRPTGGGREVTVIAEVEDIPVWCPAESWPRLRGVFDGLAG
jgi:alpha-glucosidase (family GH31 glycosyl hydrolase)